MASGLFPSAVVDNAIGGVDYDTDTFYVMLVTSAYAPDFDTHTRRSSVTNEVSGTGYTAGGQSVTVTVPAYDTTNNRLDITLGGATWASSTITARGAVYYKRRGGASSADELIAYVDFGADVISSAGTFTLNSSTFRSGVN
jgi:flagellar basal body rod protein FlgG